MKKQNIRSYLLIALASLLLSSCVKHKDLVNFRDVEFPISQPEDILNQVQVKIQKDDNISIRVYSYDPEAAAPFNIMQGRNNGSVQLGGNNLNAARLFLGYLVDDEGYIDYPILGRLFVEGMTLNQLKEDVTGRLQPYLKDAVVNVKFLNFKFTIIGEVDNPSTYNITNNRVSIFDAIGLAGDMTDYANRTNVLVIREVNGKREYGKLDLQSIEVFESPYFYLTQNDVIYIEPLKVRTATVADPITRYLTYTSAALSIITLIVAFSR